MSGSVNIPLTMTAAGPVPTAPATLLATLLTTAEALSPGLTVLPGGLIDDMSGTATGAAVQLDQARVDAVNSVTPLGANPFILAQLGAQFGIPQGVPTNTSAYVIFGASGGSGPNGAQPGTPGVIIPAGTLVSDGTYQYATQDVGVLLSTGYSAPVYVVSTTAGSFAVPVNAISSVVTSAGAGISLAVYNPSAGLPGQGAQSVSSYRNQILTATAITVTGVPAMVKTLLYAVSGVQQQLVSIPKVSGGWQVICGGGDPYAVASAILQGVPDISALQGSQLAITAMTAASPVVITTNLAHGFVAGDTFVVAGATPSAYNLTYTVASVTPLTITTTTNGSAFGTYTGGAYFSPNPRDITVSVFQNPNTYSITRVNPPQQIVTVAATWNTTLIDFTAGPSVNQLAVPAMASYINSIYAGMPINLLELTATFQNAVASVLPTVNLTTLQFVATINGVTASPSAGTSIIESDPESYFYCSPTGATSAQG